jgi:hypothetical protein
VLAELWFFRWSAPYDDRLTCTVIIRYPITIHERAHCNSVRTVIPEVTVPQVSRLYGTNRIVQDGNGVRYLAKYSSSSLACHFRRIMSHICRSAEIRSLFENVILYAVFYTGYTWPSSAI